MVTKEILFDDLTTLTKTPTTSTSHHNNEQTNSIKRISPTSSNNEIFLNKGFQSECDTCLIINMNSSNSITFESEPLKRIESVSHDSKTSTTNINTINTNNNINNKSLFTTNKDTRFLNAGLNNFETVSLSELDNFKHKKKLSVYYKNQIKRFQNKFTHNKNHFMERLVNKNGQANINRVNIESRHRKYISDLFNTIVDMAWSHILIVFLMSFVISWFIFGLIWFIIIQISDDICISNIDKNSSIFESFVFSIETQQTIGYGYRYITQNCRFSMIILMVQCAFSVFLESFLGGVIFAKLSRPKKRTETLVFSKQAVIALRDGVYNLMVRVGDLRKSHIILAHVKMYLIRSRFTTEGEYIPCEILELPVMNLNKTDLLLFMPIIVAHKIDETSPLYDMISFNNFETNSYADEFLTNDFEIIVTLEGTVESTGASTQARTSFLPSEIIWNHVFEPLISISSNNSKATIDFSLFNNTTKIENLKQDTNSSNRKYSIFSNVNFKRNLNDENNLKKLTAKKNFKTIKSKIPFISSSKSFVKQDSKFQLV